MRGPGRYGRTNTLERERDRETGGGGSESLCSRQAGAGGGALLAALCGLDTLKPSSQFSIKYRHTTHIAVRPLLTTPPQPWNEMCGTAQSGRKRCAAAQWSRERCARA
jgi:hypothetical protein